VVSSFQRFLQLLLATALAAWCSAAYGLPFPSSASVAIATHATHHGPVLRQCIERVAPNADPECEVDEAPSTQQRFHAPDLLGLDDQPEDEELGAASGQVKVYGPREVELGCWHDRLSPKLEPHTQLERPPRV
jgi:hypothetical protein